MQKGEVNQEYFSTGLINALTQSILTTLQTGNNI